MEIRFQCPRVGFKSFESAFLGSLTLFEGDTAQLLVQSNDHIEETKYVLVAVLSKKLVLMNQDKWGTEQFVKQFPGNHPQFQSDLPFLR